MRFFLCFLPIPNCEENFVGSFEQVRANTFHDYQCVDHLRADVICFGDGNYLFGKSETLFDDVTAATDYFFCFNLSLV